MDPGDFFQERILPNFVVRNNIFRYLSRSELLNCSLVSKTWVSPTRQFQRGHHSCLLTLIVRKPEKLAAAVDLLENSSEMLYNGVYLDLKYVHVFSHIGRNGCKELFYEVKPILRNIFRQIPMKFVRTESEDRQLLGWRCLKMLRFCLDLVPVEQIEDLKIRDVLYDNWRFVFRLSGKGRLFSELKVLDVGTIKFNSTSLSKFLANFPALREWRPRVYPSELACFVEVKKEYLIKNLCFGYSGTILPKSIPCMQAAQVVLKRIRAYYLDPNPEYVQLFWHLLRTSKSSLQEVGMCLHFFLHFVRSGNYPLNNVTELAIYLRYNDENSVENTRETIRQDVDTRRIFPNAANIKVSRV